jgi:hypothetical protein
LAPMDHDERDNEVDDHDGGRMPRVRSRRRCPAFRI